MNKLQTTIAMTGLLAIGILLFSCNDDDAIRPTGEDGRPSTFYIEGGETIGLAYKDGRLSATKKEDGSSTNYAYKKGELKEISINPPRDVADGHGWTTFEKTDKNKIKVSSTGEPSFSESRREIELDEQGRVTKIQFLGIFSSNKEDFAAQEPSHSILSYDEAGNLTKIESYKTKEELLYRTCSFRYDQSKGSMSHSGLPDWYAAYLADRSISSYTPLATCQFLNIHNNVTEISISEKAHANPFVIHIDYTYNKNDYPTSAFTNDPEKEKLDIRY